jgi:hypothetical protein
LEKTEWRRWKESKRGPEGAGEPAKSPTKKQKLFEKKYGTSQKL